MQGPLDLALTLESGQAFLWGRDGATFHGVVGGTLFLLRQAPGGVEFSCVPASEEAGAQALAAYLRLDDDLDVVYRNLSFDRRLRMAFNGYRGLRILRQGPWECLASFVCSSHANIPRISRMVEALARAYGEPVALGSVQRHTFPSPERLAEAGEGALRALGLGFRAAYLASTAGLVAGGAVDLDALRAAPFEEARRALMALPGVGEKVADCVLLFALDKLEAFPIDRWVERSLRQWYPVEGMRSYRALQEWARAHFGPWAGYAQQYLFVAQRQGLSGQGDATGETAF
ncbi:MAG: hypothetical protein HY686_01750 [Chloroflexi bacterium]|nr:hypothetical protein [Chloroflexota bacterium]